MTRSIQLTQTQLELLEAAGTRYNGNTCLAAKSVGIESIHTFVRVTSGLMDIGFLNSRGEMTEAAYDLAGIFPEPQEQN